MKRFTPRRADVAELADALDSGSSRGNSVEVQVLSSAPKNSKELLGLISSASPIGVPEFVPFFGVPSPAILQLGAEPFVCLPGR